ncbi:MAG TPA: phosphoserine phosphatase SerB [Rhodobacteraceae bacterium]|nr:phosphoserine phosphatase SerB [Paracoccaceae bacterium]
MDYIATLIAAPASDALTPAMAATAASVLPGEVRVHWLATGEACALHFHDEGAREESEIDLRATLRGLPVDIAVLPDTPARRKRLLIADMDSTIIGQECIDEIADMAGVGEQVADITARAMRGNLGFRDAMMERIDLIAGLDEAALARVADERLHLNPGARTLVQTMRRHGAFCALVSGGFTFFTRIIAERAGFHAHRGNELIFRNGRLTGVGEPLIGREAKRSHLFAFADEQDLPLELSLAVGDGANDLDMLESAGLGVAVHAKPLVAEEADVSIRHGDLTALLYLQGYEKADFIL